MRFFALRNVVQFLVVLVWLRHLGGASRTFQLPKGERPSRTLYMFTLSIAVLAYVMATATLEPRLVPPGILLLASSFTLFEWARTSIKGRFFSYAGSNDTPDFLWTFGPFAYIRNPFYTSYMLSYLAVGVMFPSLVPLVVIGVMAFFYVRMARHEERKFARSPLAEEYAAYARRTGRFFPKLAGR